jgi:hypothetical protein
MDNGGHPVQRVPAPWTLKAESYLLFLKLGELPKRVYAGLEAAWEDEAFGRFEGGLGAVMIVRYTDTPVGRLSLLDLISSLVVRAFAWMSVIELFQPRNRDRPYVQSLTKCALMCRFLYSYLYQEGTFMEPDRESPFQTLRVARESRSSSQEHHHLLL